MPRGVYDRTKKTKKATTKGSPAKARVSRFTTPEVLKLDELTLYKMRMLDAELKSLQQEVVIQKGVKEALISKVDPSGVLKKLDQKVQGLTSSYHSKAQEYAQLRQDIGEKLGIEMKDYAYDETTGVLHDVTTQAPVEEVESLPK